MPPAKGENNHLSPEASLFSMQTGIDFRCTTIGRIIPDIQSGYYTEMTGRIKELLRGYGYLIYFCNTSYSYELVERHNTILIQNNIDGIIDFNRLVSRENKGIFIPFSVLDGQFESVDEDFPPVETDKVPGILLPSIIYTT
jgi:DNA-binding LacI/PurR family transcriptional regulator